MKMCTAVTDYYSKYSSTAKLCCSTMSFTSSTLECTLIMQIVSLQFILFSSTHAISHRSTIYYGIIIMLLPLTRNCNFLRDPERYTHFHIQYSVLHKITNMLRRRGLNKKRKASTKGEIRANRSAERES